MMRADFASWTSSRRRVCEQKRLRALNPLGIRGGLTIRMHPDHTVEHANLE
jgi:hypothetical protein